MSRIFLISDNHFGAEDVRRIFKRPFKTIGEMDREMIKRWNRIVKPEDIVISLGDFSWEPTRRYSEKLKGNKILIRGNHDWGPEAGGEHMVLEYQGNKFYLVHDPDKVHELWNWNEWVIHGHHHWMPEYPFIDGTWKTINVACELINYTPIELDWILSLDIDTIKRMETADSEPVRYPS